MNQHLTEIYQTFLKCSGVSIDSRNIKANYMFFAFKGEKTDGHNYVNNILQVEGCVAIIDDASFYIDERTILVSDTLACLQNLANLYRESFEVPVIGITGSNGKTTTKELIVSVLSQKYKVHATSGNYNNHIGVPLTLLSAPSDAEILVIEMGANRLKDIEDLCHIANPDFGIITNIGSAHVEGFGSLENILIGKTELYAHIEQEDGLLFVNKNDEKLLSKLPDNVDVRLYPLDEFEIKSGDYFIKIIDLENHQEYNTSLYGIYNALNIHAALCIAKYFNVNKAMSCQAIGQYSPQMNRSQIIDSGSVKIIMDAYNANPTSMKASLDSFFALQTDRKKIMILGDMMELGDKSVQFHRDILSLIKVNSYDQLILVGPLFKLADERDEFEHFKDIDSLIDFYGQAKSHFANAILLLKASRSIQLEKLLNVWSNES